MHLARIIHEGYLGAAFKGFLTEQKAARVTDRSVDRVSSSFFRQKPCQMLHRADFGHASPARVKQNGGERD
jgi:hypothetical protein